MYSECIGNNKDRLDFYIDSAAKVSPKNEKNNQLNSSFF